MGQGVSRLRIGIGPGAAGRAAMVLSAMMLAAACSSSSAPDLTARVAIGEPVAIDPALAVESEGIGVARLLFVGLVTYDGNPELTMRPGVAQSWTSGDGCREWRFNLRASQFSNGEEVTAESFVRGWSRVADGAAASPLAYHLAGVRGYQEVHGSPQPGATRAGTTLAGLSAPDPRTLVVSLAAPDCEFDKKALTTALSPVPASAGKAGDRGFGEAPVGNGPFKLRPGTRWEHDRRISLVRHDGYFGPQPALSAVELTILSAADPVGAEYRAFQAGALDFARIPPALVDQARAAYQPGGGFLRADGFGINYLLTNDGSGPMRDPEARRAVSLALDRAAIAKGVFKGALAPATSLLPPALGGAHAPGVCGDCRFDPVAARASAERAQLGPGTRLRLVYNTESGLDALVQALKDQLDRNLGVVVDLRPLPFSQYLDARNRGDYELATAAWGPDYPTADSYMYPLFAAGSDDNDSHYRNPELDALLAEARAEANSEARVAASRRAEQLAIGRDLAAIPTFYRTQYRVFRPDRLPGVALDFFENPTLASIARR